MPRAGHLSSPSTVDPGREQPPCFGQAPVPDPVRGLLTPRSSRPSSAPRSHARSRSPDALNRRSERRSDRSLIARSIHSLDERDADVWISAVDIRGEQKGEHREGTPPPREVFPLPVTWHSTNRGRRKWCAPRDCFRQLQSSLRVAERTHRAALCAASQVQLRQRGGQSQYLGVSDHHFGPPGLPSPRPARWSLTPRCLLSQPERSSLDSRIQAALNACRSTSRPSAVARSLCGSHLARSRRSALARFRSARAARG